MRELRANIVRVGMRTFIVPEGHYLDHDAIVLGKAKADTVYEAFYEATHHRCGHLRRCDDPTRCRYRCLGYRPTNYPPEWTWGKPA